MYATSREDRNHLFLLKRRKEWLVAWNSVIVRLYSSRRSNPLVDEKAHENDVSHQLDDSPPQQQKKRSKKT
jgi:hypothetical protein